MNQTELSENQRSILIKKTIYTTRSVVVEQLVKDGVLATIQGSAGYYRGGQWVYIYDVIDEKKIEEEINNG